MKQQLNWSFGIVATLASLNLATQATAQPLGHVDLVLSTEKTDSSSSQTTSAQEFFRKAYENRYTWNPQFPGYTATLELKHNQEKYKGHVRVNPDMSVEVTGINKEDIRQIAENQLKMLVIHRRRVPFEVAHKNSTFQLGSTDTSGAVEIFEQADQTESHYKVLQQQLLQVNRLLGKTAVTVDTLDTEVTPFGYLATRYRTTFRQPQTKQVLGVEESKDTYKKMGGYYLPIRQVIHDFQQGQITETAEFNYTDIQLLPTRPKNTY